MARHTSADGVWLEYDDQVFRVHEAPGPATPGAGASTSDRPGPANPAARPASPTSRRTRRGVLDDESPVLLTDLGTPAAEAAAPNGTGPSAGTQADASSDPARHLADRLQARGVVHQAGPTLRFAAGPAAASGQRATRAPSRPSTLHVPVAAGEQAVVLVEGDGVLAWRFASGTDTADGDGASATSASALAAGRPRSTRGGPGAVPAASRRAKPQADRVLVFELDIPPVAAPEPTATAGTRGGATRGWLRDRLVAGVKAIVLYFAAEATAVGVVHLLERRKRNGPVVINSATDPGQWLRPDDLRDVRLPTDRPPRLLLLVHGTFSSTLGGFGELCATPWGRQWLSAALQRYDAVLGLDHRTLSLDPQANARALLDALRSLPTTGGQALQADAVCHSRGGLVLRSFIEQLLPGSGLPLTVQRAIFVAATNRGTELARPENWETLVDLVTNLSSMGARVLSMFPATAVAAQVTDEVIDCLGDFVKYLVNVAVKARRVPGLAAMDPAGAFVATLNQTQAGQPSAADLSCYAVVSDFYAKLLPDGGHEPKEMPRRLAFLLADKVIDRLMRGDNDAPVANDLVVDVASMTEIDTAVGGYVRDVLDFGHNPLVYHTNYFLRPETVGRLAQWLRLPAPDSLPDPLALAGAHTRGLLTLPVHTPVALARQRIAAESPDFLVFERPHPMAGPGHQLHYALTPAEFALRVADAPDDLSVDLALNLRETQRSPEPPLNDAPLDRGAALPPLPPTGAAGRQRSSTTRGSDGARHLTPPFPSPGEVNERVREASARRQVLCVGQQVAGVLDAGSMALDTAALARLAWAHEAEALDAMAPAAGASDDAAAAAAPPPPPPPPPPPAPRPPSSPGRGQASRAMRNRIALPEVFTDGDDDGGAPMAAPPGRGIHESREMAVQPAPSGRRGPVSASPPRSSRAARPAREARPSPAGARPPSARLPKAAAPAPAAGGAAAAGPATAPPLHALAEMPRQVAEGRLATVAVTLSAEVLVAAANMASVGGQVSLPQPTQPLSVHVQPRQGLDYTGDGSDCLVTVDPPQPGQPVLLDFVLKAVEAGPAVVSITLRQGARRLLVMDLQAEVLAPGTAPARGQAAATARPEPAADTGACAVLDIRDHRRAGSLRFEYVLNAGGVNNRFESATVKVAPGAYVAARYREIEKAWTGSQRAVDQFALRLEALGAGMFRQLFPIELQRALWQLLQAGELDDILVYSDEPFLPWEVVFLDDPDAPAATGKGRFFGELGLCRWLYGAATTTQITVHPGAVRHVVPQYPGHLRLASAEMVEAPMLEALLQSTALPATHAAVVAALQQPGSFDLLHFAGHGEADADDIDAAALLLEGERLATDQGQAWVKEALRATVVAQQANLRQPDGNRPLVFINACQTGRMGYSLTGLGGFAPAFLGAREGVADTRGRAGGFVGALWAVDDQLATHFSQALYQALKGGAPMAEAVRQARTAARGAGEATWLAYAVYAHPHLRLRFV